MKFKSVIVLLFFLGAFTVFSQEVSLPVRTNWFQYISEYGYSPSMRIWGWSRDGSVAYSLLKPAEGRGGYITTLYIFDMVNDTIVWTNSKSSFPDDDDNDYQYFVDFQESHFNNVSPNGYEIFFQEFYDVCNTHEIELIQAEFNKLPVVYNNQIYNVSLDIMQQDDDFEIMNYKITVHNQGRQKTIFEKNDAYVYGVSLCGYFISPFEDRALIVIAEQYRETWTVVFSGCHLRTGFN